MPKAEGHVYIAGAGCLGPAGMTREVCGLLESSDVLVVDALVSPDCWQGFSGTVIDAGKTAGSHHMRQTDINDLLVRLAKEGKRVLRLKGGDPFVFGRGREELDALEKAGVRASVHSGLTSPVAICARAGIPVTDRRLSGGFLVLSAHPAKGEPDYQTAARFDGTVLFLMARTAIPGIRNGLLEAGMDPDCPAAVLQTAPDGYTTATKSTLKEMTVPEDAWPTMVVVGRTAALASDKPVVAVTCSDGLYEKLKAETAGLVHLRRALKVRYEPLPLDWETILSRPGWLVFCSESGSRLFLDQMKADKVDIRRLAGFEIACIGPATAAPFAAAGIQVHLPPEPNTKSLQAFLAGKEPVRTFREQESSHELEGALHAARTDLYRTVYEPGDLAPGCLTVFASTKAVRAWKEKIGALPDSLLAISDITGRALEKPYVCAREVNAAGLARAILSCTESACVRPE